MIFKVLGSYKFKILADTDNRKYKEFFEMRRKMNYKKTDITDYAKYIFDESSGVITSDDMEWRAREI